MIKQIKEFVKKETVLTIAWILAVISCFFVRPDIEYAEYIDIRTLGVLWSLMVIMQGFKVNGVFEEVGQMLLGKTKKVWQLCSVLIFLCFFTSMLITNDVALITFVPFALLMLKNCNRKELIIPVVVLQTMAANLGSMLTPVGNPQNLYLYGESKMGLGEFLLWMLPYTAMSFILIAISICFLKGKNDAVAMEISNSQEKTLEEKNIKNNGKKRNICIIVYGLLFALALLVVLKVVEYYVLVAAVLIIVLIVQRKVLLEIDYALLLTFIGFFIFTGNLGRIAVIRDTLVQLIEGKEIIIAVIASQGISNVPAALLLSGFTTNYRALLLGVDIGGLGTLIASMASLISYKMVAHEYNEIKGKYFVRFTWVGLVYLAILLLEAFLLTKL